MKTTIKFQAHESMAEIISAKILPHLEKGLNFLLINIIKDEENKNLLNYIGEIDLIENDEKDIPCFVKIQIPDSSQRHKIIFELWTDKNHLIYKSSIINLNENN